MIRSFHAVPVILLVAAFLIGGARLLDAAPAVDCRVPPELIEDDPKLPVVAEHFAAKQPITIVAIGGASTAGTAAGDGEANSYPHRLEEALRRRHPGIPITVINVAIPRQTTSDMVQRFATDVAPRNPTLVIWETGTVDAVRRVDVDQFAAAMQDGIAALRQHNFDIFLVNMQYNPSTGSVIDFEPYLEALRHAADLDDVSVFRRFEIMKYWSDNDVFNFVDVPKDQRLRLAEEVYRCLGENLAQAIDFAAK